MNKTAQTELYRLFLIEKLPEPLTPASSHLQLFDNYVEGTRLRLRHVRDPYSKSWTRILQQRIASADGEFAVKKLSEIYLNDEEYAHFERLEGREIRKNRYFHEFDLASFAFDVYLGNLWGLTTARVDFEDQNAKAAFVAPPFAIFEITDNEFFDGSNLVDRKFSDIQEEVSRIGASTLVAGR